MTKYNVWIYISLCILAGSIRTDAKTITTAAKAATATVSETPTPTEPAPIDYIRQPFQTCEEAAQKIETFATALQKSGDRRSLFPHIYALTIAATNGHLATGDFENPEWIRALVLNYANIYRRTILFELSVERSQVARAWQLDFVYNESAAAGQWSSVLDVVYGISVHISRDLVEALFLTPTDFSSDSQTRDFNKISDILSQTMPAIWAVFTNYGDSVPLPDFMQQSVMNEWIRYLRSYAWYDAATNSTLSEAGKQLVLDRIDGSITDQALHFGVLLPMQRLAP